MGVLLLKRIAVDTFEPGLIFDILIPDHPVRGVDAGSGALVVFISNVAFPSAILAVLAGGSLANKTNSNVVCNLTALVAFAS